MRSLLGIWGSILGFTMVSIALVQTWLSPIVNLYSGLACLTVLTIGYLILKSQSK